MMKKTKTKILLIISVILCVCLTGALVYLNGMKEDTVPDNTVSESSQKTESETSSSQKDDPIDQGPNTTVRPVEGDYTPSYSDKTEDLTPMAIDADGKDKQSSSNDTKQDNAPSETKKEDDKKQDEQNPSSNESSNDGNEEKPAENDQGNSQGESSQTPSDQNEDTSHSEEGSSSQHDNKGTDLPPVPLH